MSIDVTIEGLPTWNTTSYSISESSTPLDPASSAGAFGQFTIVADEMPNDKKLIGKTIQVRDGARGVTQGIITGAGADGMLVTITGNNLISRTSVTVTALPYHGTLSGLVTYYLSLVGITTGYLVDDSISSIPVSTIGWRDNLYDQLKTLVTGLQIEMTFVSNSIVFRPTRSYIAKTYRDSDKSWDLDNTQIVQQISAYYYQAAWDDLGVAHPLYLPDDNSDINQVDAGQIIEVTFDLTPSGDGGIGRGASLSSIQQPEVFDSVPRGYTEQSAYSVIGNDNKPYLASRWTSLGGSVTATISEDTQSVTVQIIGPRDYSLSPFRLAASTDGGTTDFYSTLVLVGSGEFYDKQLYTIPTGNEIEQTAQVENTIIDNYAINTWSDAHHALLSGIRNASGPTQKLTVASFGINAPGDSQSFSRITFAKFDSIYSSFADFDNQFGTTSKFQDVDDYFFSLVSNEFANQSFGNVAGARVWDDYSYYRISDATLTASGVSYTALVDNTIGDWDEVWGGATFGDWDDSWAGQRFIDYSPTLLYRESDYVVPVIHGYGAGNYGDGVYAGLDSEDGDGSTDGFGSDSFNNGPYGP